MHYINTGTLGMKGKEKVVKIRVVTFAMNDFKIPELVSSFKILFDILIIIFLKSIISILVQPE